MPMTEGRFPANTMPIGRCFCVNSQSSEWWSVAVMVDLPVHVETKQMMERITVEESHG